MFFHSLFSRELLRFHLKEAPYGSSLVYLNYQHHYFCTLGPLLSKIKVTSSLALGYPES